MGNPNEWYGIDYCLHCQKEQKKANPLGDNICLYCQEQKIYPHQLLWESDQPDLADLHEALIQACPKCHTYKMKHETHCRECKKKYGKKEVWIEIHEQLANLKNIIKLQQAEKQKLSNTPKPKHRNRFKIMDDKVKPYLDLGDQEIKLEETLGWEEEAARIQHWVHYMLTLKKQKRKLFNVAHIITGDYQAEMRAKIHAIANEENHIILELDNQAIFANPKFSERERILNYVFHYVSRVPNTILIINQPGVFLDSEMRLYFLERMGDLTKTAQIPLIFLDKRLEMLPPEIREMAAKHTVFGEDHKPTGVELLKKSLEEFPQKNINYQAIAAVLEKHRIEQRLLQREIRIIYDEAHINDIMDDKSKAYFITNKTVTAAIKRILARTR